MKVFNIVCFLCIRSIMSNPSHNLSRIIAGFNCSLEEYPHIVSIMIRHMYSHVCGGTAVKPLWVLTAAHCFITNPENLIVITGTLSTEKLNISQEVQVLASYGHPEYSRLHNDIGLLRLKEELHESEKFKYISLSTEAFTNTFVNSCSNSIVMGYGGQTRKTLAGVTVSPSRDDNTLKCVNLSVISDGVCDGLIQRHIGHFCAMDLTGEHKGTCHGDSGGPIICNGKQIGIVSGGYGCGQGSPTLYTKVSSYTEFIEYTIASRGLNEMALKGMPFLSGLLLGIL